MFVLSPCFEKKRIYFLYFLKIEKQDHIGLDINESVSGKEAENLSSKKRKDRDTDDDNNDNFSKSSKKAKKEVNKLNFRFKCTPWLLLLFLQIDN